MRLPFIRNNIFTSEQGGLIILWAFVLPAVIGSIGIGVEVSSWYARKSDIQSATDAAALATSYAVGGSSNLTTIASNEMSRNGFGTNSGITLTVNNPPSTGTYSGNNNAVELIVSQNEAPLFSKVLGHGQTTIKVRAVALNTPSSSGGGCIMALNQTQGYSIDINGNATINMPGCSMIDNSNNSSAVALNGNATVTVTNIYTAGGIMTNGHSTINNTSPNVTNGSVVPDPFSNLAMPAFSGCDQNNFTAQHGSVTMTPGVYCGGINFNAQANVTMSSGTYIVNGGSFNINGQASVTGSDVTIIFTGNSTINVNGGATVTLSAPTTGTYAGILLYADRNSQANYNNFNGGSSMALTGVVYMPSENINFNGGVSSGGSCTKIIANTVTINGGANLSPTCPAGYPTIPIPGTNSGIRIVE